MRTTGLESLVADETVNNEEVGSLLSPGPGVRSSPWDSNILLSLRLHSQAATAEAGMLGAGVAGGAHHRDQWVAERSWPQKHPDFLRSAPFLLSWLLL